MEAGKRAVAGGRCKSLVTIIFVYQCFRQRMVDESYRRNVGNAAILTTSNFPRTRKCLERLSVI